MINKKEEALEWLTTVADRWQSFDWVGADQRNHAEFIQRMIAKMMDEIDRLRAIATSLSDGAFADMADADRLQVEINLLRDVVAAADGELNPGRTRSLPEIQASYGRWLDARQALTDFDERNT